MDGFPRKLKRIKPLVDSRDPRTLRVILTILSMGRSFTSPTLRWSRAAIETPPTTQRFVLRGDLLRFEEFVSARLRHHRVDPGGFFQTFWPVALGAGPCGPALASAVYEARLMPEEYLSTLSAIRPDLVPPIRFLKGLREETIESWKTVTDITTLHFWRAGRVAAIPDKEGKTRLIAIVNY